jgi:hypothetical protein
MKVIRLILLLPLDVLIILGIVIGLLTSKIDEILKIAVIGLIDFKHKMKNECETTETSEVK